MEMNVTPALVDAALRMREELKSLKFSAPVSHVYQPLDYAWERHVDYLTRYGSGKKRILFLGMNPGPYGMAQTGVPFGEIPAVRDWMKISGEVGQPCSPHPKRPISGFACTRSEVSGRRLWGLFSTRFPDANDFFRDHFVANYCPLIWMSQTGANVTPDKLSAAERDAVDRICLEHLRSIVEIFEPEHLIGVGAYARERLEKIHTPSQHRVSQILHPSPASPAANRDWAGTAVKQMIQSSVWTQ
jgi:single-strand selective monofunctional uracil DNA glycosylase